MDVPVIHLGSHSYRFGISAGMGYDAAVCQEVMITQGKKISQPSPYGQTDLSYGGAETVSLPHPVFGYGNL